MMKALLIGIGVVLGIAITIIIVTILYCSCRVAGEYDKRMGMK